MHNVISSQRYLDDAIVADKREAGDYTVTVYDIPLDGVLYQVVVDGHHSLAAAREAGVTPDYTAPSQAVTLEYAYELELLGAVQWLEDHQLDSEYYYVDSGGLVWA